MEGSCSFESLVGTLCSFDRKDKHRSTEIVPLSLCNKDVTGHKSTWSFSGIESETDLILACAGIFSVTLRDLSSFNICPFRHSELSIGCRRNSYSNSCQVSKEIANHEKKRETCESQQGSWKEHFRIYPSANRYPHSCRFRYSWFNYCIIC